MAQSTKGVEGVGASLTQWQPRNQTPNLGTTPSPEPGPCMPGLQQGKFNPKLPGYSPRTNTRR